MESLSVILADIFVSDKKNGELSCPRSLDVKLIEVVPYFSSKFYHVFPLSFEFIREVIAATSTLSSSETEHKETDNDVKWVSDKYDSGTDRKGYCEWIHVGEVSLQDP